MTPKEAAISVLEKAANKQGGLLTRRQGQESIMSHLQREEQLHKAAIDWAKSMPASVTIYGKPPTKALQEFIDSLHAAGWNGTGDAQWENITRLWSKLFIEPVMAYHANKPLNITVDHDGDCNLLNGADGASCNCTARERQKMQDWITELESERDDFKRALDDLGVTPGEARNGAARSRERVARMAELEDANKRMHGMIMSIRDHVGAYNTPTDPADIDIIKCVTDKYDKLQESVEDLESGNENLQIEHDVMFARIRDNNSQYTPEEVSRLIDSEILVHRNSNLEHANELKKDRIVELEEQLSKYTEADRNKTDWCPVCKQGWDCHKEDQASRIRIGELEKYIKERSSPLFVVSPVELSEEDMARLKAAMNTQMPIEIVPLGMTIHGMTQLVCSELPENYQIHIHMENGYGEAILYFPTQEPPYDGSLDGSTLADANIEKQIVELVKLAKGEPSEYDPEQP